MHSTSCDCDPIPTTPKLRSNCLPWQSEVMSLHTGWHERTRYESRRANSSPLAPAELSLVYTDCDRHHGKLPQPAAQRTSCIKIDIDMTVWQGHKMSANSLAYCLYERQGHSSKSLPLSHVSHISGIDANGALSVPNKSMAEPFQPQVNVVCVIRCL